MDIVERLRRTELHHVWDDLEGKMVGKMFSANPDGPEAADEIERLQNVNKAQAKWLYDEQQAHKALRDKVRQWLRDDKPDILKDGN